MSSLNLDTSVLIAKLNNLASNKLFVDYNHNHIKAVGVDGFDVIVMTTDGKDHRLVGLNTLMSVQHTEQGGYHYYLVPVSLSSQVEDVLREDAKREIEVIDLITHIVFKTDEPIHLA